MQWYKWEWSIWKKLIKKSCNFLRNAMLDRMTLHVYYYYLHDPLGIPANKMACNSGNHMMSYGAYREIQTPILLVFVQFS